MRTRKFPFVELSVLQSPGLSDLFLRPSEIDQFLVNFSPPKFAAGRRPHSRPGDPVINANLCGRWAWPVRPPCSDVRVTSMGGAAPAKVSVY